MPATPGVIQGRIAGLDGLRAIAILAVIAWHGALSLRFPAELMGPLRHFVMTGWAGVDLFFALSGFLITTMLLREEQAEHEAGRAPRFSLRKFYIRRALRILPVFYVAFGLITFVAARFPIFVTVQARGRWLEKSALGLLPYATFWGNYFVSYMQGLFSGPVLDPGEAYTVFWSLCVEEHFYLLWPLLLFACRDPNVRWRLALGICLLLPALRFFVEHFNFDSRGAVHSISHYRFDSLLWGAVGAVCLPWIRAHPSVYRWAGAFSGGVVVLLVALGDISVLPPGSALGSALGFSALAIASSALIVEVTLHPLSRLVAVLEARPLQLIGKWSYAMYLIHFPMIDLGRVLFFATNRQPTLLNLCFALVLFALLSAAAAWVLHVLVERPFLKLKSRWAA